jgi:hypothetical protein
MAALIFIQLYGNGFLLLDPIAGKHRRPPMASGALGMSELLRAGGHFS